MSSFAEALADHLNWQAQRYVQVDGPLRPEDITDITVRWSEGEQGTDDYGDEYTRLPELSVSVEVIGPLRLQADPAWCIENLMRSALGLELNP